MPYKYPRYPKRFKFQLFEEFAKSLNIFTSYLYGRAEKELSEVRYIKLELETVISDLDVICLISARALRGSYGSNNMKHCYEPKYLRTWIHTGFSAYIVISFHFGLECIYLQ